MASATCLCAAPEWTSFRSPGFEVVTNAGERAGRGAMMFFEQFRHALGRMVGVEEMKTLEPIRVMVFRSKAPVPAALIAGRNRFLIPLAAEATPPPALLRDLANLLIETNTERMPGAFERGLVTLFSTLQVQGTHITLGSPPAPAERTREWAMVHMLSVDPEYYGRTRVLLYNLRRGVDEDAAYRNAFGKPAAVIARQADEYYRADKFPATEVSGKAISPRDFPERPIEQDAIEASLADLKAPPDPARAQKLILALAAPHAEAARKATDVATRVKEWQAAATAMPRRSDYWQGLAEALLDQKNFTEAARAWRSAEQAAAGEAEREQIRQARAKIEQQRLDFEAAEKKRIAEEKQREIDRLKAQALAEVRALEVRANRGQQPGAGGQAVPWWDGPQASGRASGELTRVDCLNSQARLLIRTGDGKTVRLMLRDPSQVVIQGGGEHTLGCGPQKGRRVKVEYFPKPDAKLGAAGDVATIEFQ